MVSLVIRRHLHPYPRLALGHYGIQEPDDVNSFGEQLGGHALSEHGVIDA
jgi:hypothetical protein